MCWICRSSYDVYFCSVPPIVQRLFEGGVYWRAVFIQRKHGNYFTLIGGIIIGCGRLCMCLYAEKTDSNYIIMKVWLTITQVSQGIQPLQAQGMEEGTSHALKCGEAAVVVKWDLQCWHNKQFHNKAKLNSSTTTLAQEVTVMWVVSTRVNYWLIVSRVKLLHAQRLHGTWTTCRWCMSRHALFHSSRYNTSGYRIQRLQL